MRKWTPWAVLVTVGCGGPVEPDGGLLDAAAAADGSSSCTAAVAAPVPGETHFCPSVHDAVEHYLRGELDAAVLDAGPRSCEDAGGPCTPFTAEWSLILGCPEWAVCTIGLHDQDGGAGCYHCATWGSSPWAL
jgi:hypothetical protein